MEKLRVIDTNLGFGINTVPGSEVSKSQQQDIDTLSIINEEITLQLKSEQIYKDFHEWLEKNGAKYPAVDYPVAFGKNGELMGLAAKKDIPPQKAFLFIPQKMIINELVCKKDPICGPVYEKHPEIFKDHFDAEYLLMIVFVMHHMLIGEKSFWCPFWKIINMSDMPMRWSYYEVCELQDNYLQREIQTFRDEYFKEFDLIFDTFRNNGYEDVWPGVCGEDKIETKNKMEKLFYKCFNTIVTRCFGWGLPKTSMIPLADCINHHNVDSTYEFICEKLHEPIKNLTDSHDKYTIDINEFIEDNRKILEIDNMEDQEDASYYTKSKMMFDISDYYIEKQECSDKFKALKINNKKFQESAEPDENEEIKVSEDVRSQKLTNRSIHTIKKFLMREEAYKLTPDNLLNEQSINRVKDIWDLDYKSTSDEEDNDSADEEAYGNVSYPKPRLQSEGSQQPEQPEEKKKPEKKVVEDVVSKLIEKDKALVRRDLEARLARVKRQQANLKRYRKMSSITLDELVTFDETEDYSWWKGIEDDRGVYFAMGTKFSSSYKKGDQLFNCYGRRTNRFLLVNYGFCLRNNKYNSLGFKVFVNYTDKDKDEKQQHQKVIRMKLNRLSLDLLQYLRANLVFSFTFKDPKVRNMVTVSTPVDTDFEILCLEQAIGLIESMIKTKYSTTLDFDLRVLDILSTKDFEFQEIDSEETKNIKILIKSKKNLWRFKLALMHRANQKEILHNQLKYCSILLSIMRGCQKALEAETTTKADFKNAYLKPIKEYDENPQKLMRNRIIVRYYLFEYLENQNTLFKQFI